MPDRRATTAQDLIKRWEALREKRATVDVHAQEIADYLLPFQATITRQSLEGQKLTTFLFDNEGPWALTMFVNTLAGALTSAAQQWFSLSLVPEELVDNKETNDWLGDCEERMYKALGRSNFHAENLKFFRDAVGFATAALFEEELPPLVTGEFGGLLFKALPFREYAIAESHQGDVDTLCRRFMLTARTAYEKWKDKAGPKVVEAATQLNQNQEKEFHFLHCVYPRFYRDRQSRTGQNMPWASYYVSESDKTIIEEGGYEEFPFMCLRWDQTPGEVYGRGPSHLALPDVKTANLVKELLLKSAPLKMQPPSIEKQDSVVGDPDWTPGGRNTAEDTDDLKFLDTKTDIRLDQIVLADLHTSIDKCYFIQELKLKDSPAMTATEVLAKREELERLLGPTAGRIESEYLNGLVLRTFAIMYRAKAFLPTPQAVTDWMRRRKGMAPGLDVRYEGPLQRARRSLDVVAYTAVYQHLLTASQFDPHVALILKHQDVARDVAEIRGVASKYINDEKAVNVLLQQIAAAQQAQQQAQGMAQMAESLGKAAPALRELTRMQPPGQGGAIQPGTAQAA